MDIKADVENARVLLQSNLPYNWRGDHRYMAGPLTAIKEGSGIRKLRGKGKPRSSWKDTARKDRNELAIRTDVTMREKERRSASLSVPTAPTLCFHLSSPLAYLSLFSLSPLYISIPAELPAHSPQTSLTHLSLFILPRT